MDLTFWYGPPYFMWLISLGQFGSLKKWCLTTSDPRNSIALYTAQSHAPATAFVAWGPSPDRSFVLLGKAWPVTAPWHLSSRWIVVATLIQLPSSSRMHLADWYSLVLEMAPTNEWKASKPLYREYQDLFVPSSWAISHPAQTQI